MVSDERTCEVHTPHPSVKRMWRRWLIPEGHCVFEGCDWCNERYGEMVYYEYPAWVQALLRIRKVSRARRRSRARKRALVVSRETSGWR